MVAYRVLVSILVQHDYLSTDSLISLLLAQVGLFAAAVATTCLVRHAVYAAILSIPLMYFGVVTVWIALKSARALGWTDRHPSRLMDMSYPAIGVRDLITNIFDVAR